MLIPGHSGEAHVVKSSGVQCSGIPEIHVNSRVQENGYLTDTLVYLNATRNIVFDVEIGQAKQIDNGIAELLKCRISKAMCIILKGLDLGALWQVLHF